MGLKETISEIYGSSVTVAKKTPVSGGDINRAYALTLSDGSKLFMKANSRENADFFRAEAEGLEAIRKTGTISVPQVIARGEDGRESFLLLEYIEEGRPNRIASYVNNRSSMLADINRNPSEELGRQLAELHQADTCRFVRQEFDAAKRPPVIGFTREIKYGFLSDNYIGAGYQDNTPENTWTEFFVNRRLRLQFERASRYWGSEDLKKIDRFLDRADRYLEEPVHPSLIHGDLWGGNYMIDSDRRPWLIDPAAYVGHAEADLAMTELFGGFERKFYDAYREAAGIDPGYSDRRDLYNLYHLLNHLNLFGSSYLYSVRAIVERYV